MRLYQDLFPDKKLLKIMFSTVLDLKKLIKYKSHSLKIARKTE